MQSRLSPASVSAYFFFPLPALSFSATSRQSVRSWETRNVRNRIFRNGKPPRRRENHPDDRVRTGQESELVLTLRTEA